jgi:hypothetical protein
LLDWFLVNDNMHKEAVMGMMGRISTIFCLGMALLFCAESVQALTVFEKLTNRDSGQGEADGIVPGGDRQNSYSWCMETIKHTDGEYLYVGSNRSLMYGVMFAMFRSQGYTDTLTIDQKILTFFGEDIESPLTKPGGLDARARMFRYKLDGSKDWETVYTSPGTGTNPNYTGYRGMQKFTDQGNPAETAIYVVTSAARAANSVILKIPENFVLGDVPKTVFQGHGHLRATAVHDSRLYAGDDQGLWEAVNPEGTADWTQVANLADFGNIIGSGVTAMFWTLKSYNGMLYVVIGEEVDPNNEDSGGAHLFKGKYDPANPLSNAFGWVWYPVISDKTTHTAPSYPKGLGSRFNNAFALEVFNNYLYMGTLMSFPALVGADAIQFLIENRIPPQIYRCGTNDVCEMVIGDPTVLFPVRLGNYGSGFFNPVDGNNYSFNQYLWWMAVNNGRLYASTFDIRIFLDYLDEEGLVLMRMLDPNDPQYAVKLAQILGAIAALQQATDNPPGFDIYYTTDGVTWRPLTRDGFGDKFNYGGRVVLSTPSGLFVGTANPFYGGQVWKVVYIPDGDEGGGGGGQVIECFIATAAFGTPLAHQVDILREFRDRFLMTNDPGRRFVAWYYEKGPFAAAYLQEHPGLKPAVRLALYPFVIMAFLILEWKVGLLVLTGLFTAGTVLRRGRRMSRL